MELEEQSAIASKFDRYKNSSMQLSSVTCNKCGKNGHV
jgi:hypothetical protein